VRLEHARGLFRHLAVVLIGVRGRMRHDEVVLVAQGLHRGIELAALGLELAAAGGHHRAGVVAYLRARCAFDPAHVVAKLAARAVRCRRFNHAAVIAEDQHADAPPRIARARQQAAGEQLDIVAVRADEQDALGQVHAGLRCT
jgi:hypothetical protein